MKTDTLVKFNALEIETIIDKVVPLIADEKDHEFFRGVLHCKAESCKSSAHFSAFVGNLLKTVFEPKGEA